MEDQENRGAKAGQRKRSRLRDVEYNDRWHSRKVRRKVRQGGPGAEECRTRPDIKVPGCKCRRIRWKIPGPCLYSEPCQPRGVRGSVFQAWNDIRLSRRVSPRAIAKERGAYRSSPGEGGNQSQVG